MQQKFMLPGCDGELDPPANIWLKGIVFTTWADMLRPAVRPGYRVSVGFKRGVSVVGAPADFRALYERGIVRGNPAHVRVGLPPVEPSSGNLVSRVETPGRSWDGGDR